MYLLDERRGELRTAYTVGYPRPPASTAASEARSRPRRRGRCQRAAGARQRSPGRSALRRVRAGHALGDRRPTAAQVEADRCAEHPEPATAITSPSATSLSCGSLPSHVAVALVNARLFEHSRRDAEAFETLAEIAREVTSRPRSRSSCSHGSRSSPSGSSTTARSASCC